LLKLISKICVLDMSLCIWFQSTITHQFLFTYIHITSHPLSNTIELERMIYFYWVKLERINKMNFNWHIELAPSFIRNCDFASSHQVYFVIINHWWRNAHSFIWSSKKRMKWEDDMFNYTLNFKTVRSVLKFNKTWPMVVANKAKFFVLLLVLKMNIKHNDSQFQTEALNCPLSVDLLFKVF
jgi:hypothetical protein